MSSKRIPQMMPWIGREEAEAVAQTVLDNWVTEGPRSAEFSKRLNELIGVEYGVFAPNGTLALALGLMALDIGHGDEVLVPDTTFIGSATAVMMVGATPVFVEVNGGNFQIDMAKADHLVNERTKAVMPVHLFGMCCDMDAVTEFAGRYGIKVIEDAAQALGVSYKNRPAGSMGDVGCFSFFADKTLTTGEGGYVTCRDPEIYEKLRLLRNQGRMDRGTFIHPAVGFNYRITDMQAAMGLVQMDKLEAIKERKLENLERYMEGLDGVEQVRFLELEKGSSYIPFRCVILTPDAEGLTRHLQDRNIEPRGFFYPLHKQPCFAHLDKSRGGPLDLSDAPYPNALHGAETGMCLPVHPALTPEDVKTICSAIREFHES